MRDDGPFDWTTYLEELEQEAIRLRPQPRARAGAGRPAAALDALRTWAAAATARMVRTAVDSRRARG
jgi:hypothetical protein